ncbi:MAG: HRDC domain-containing protein [Culturomica sp.]|jgi:superfamily II DNA helicase RecQ|nr:HRDC domain-containing protein [Culturomica sp.]
MQIKIVNIPMSDEGTMQAELNKFLATNRVLEVEKHFFQNASFCGWSFCVNYLLNNVSGTQGAASGSFKNKVDYKQVLGEKEFAVFSKLREIRKQLSTEEAVPAYAIFTDEELAGIAQLPEIKANKLTDVQGIGTKKVEKYGKIMIERLLNYQPTEEVTIDETGKSFA